MRFFGQWLETGQEFLPQLSVITDPPLPTDGLTQFVAVTREGLRGVVAPEEELLGEGRHRLSPLFYAAQDVITQTADPGGLNGRRSLSNE